MLRDTPEVGEVVVRAGAGLEGSGEGGAEESGGYGDGGEGVHFGFDWVGGKELEI